MASFFFFSLFFPNSGDLTKRGVQGKEGWQAVGTVACSLLGALTVVEVVGPGQGGGDDGHARQQEVEKGKKEAAAVGSHQISVVAPARPYHAAEGR